MTYNVFGGTLNLAQSINPDSRCQTAETTPVEVSFRRRLSKW